MQQYFKKGEPCKARKKNLQNKLSILTKKNVYPFENDKSDVALSVSEFLIVDLDHAVLSRFKREKVHENFVLCICLFAQNFLASVPAELTPLVS